MSKRKRIHAFGALCALAMIVVATVLNGRLAAAEPARDPMPALPRLTWIPGQPVPVPVPPRRPFFGPPAMPMPMPYPPYYYPQRPLFPSGPAATVPTDRFLVIAPSIDPRSVHTARELDPGIFAAPRVQGLPVQERGRRFVR